MVWLWGKWPQNPRVWLCALGNRNCKEIHTGLKGVHLRNSCSKSCPGSMQTIAPPPRKTLHTLNKTDLGNLPSTNFPESYISNQLYFTVN